MGRGGLASHDCGGAECGSRHAGWPWEPLVETPDDFGNQMANKKFGKAAVREAMYAGAQALLDGMDGPFDFTDMAVNVEMDGREVMADTFRLVVTVDVAHDITTSKQGKG